MCILRRDEIVVNTGMRLLLIQYSLDWIICLITLIFSSYFSNSLLMKTCIHWSQFLLSPLFLILTASVWSLVNVWFCASELSTFVKTSIWLCPISRLDVMWYAIHGRLHSKMHVLAWFHIYNTHILWWQWKWLFLLIYMLNTPTAWEILISYKENLTTYY